METTTTETEAEANPSLVIAEKKSFSRPFISKSSSLAEQMTELISKPREQEIHKEQKEVQVFLNISIGGVHVGKIVIQLFTETAPLATENFTMLCTGEKGKGKHDRPLHYKGSIFHKIYPGFICIGGDFITNDGENGESVFSKYHSNVKGYFADENLNGTHSHAGLLGMVNSGPNTNTSQFYLTFGSCTHLDKKHTLFGNVVKGMEILQQIESVGSKDGTPHKVVTITDCGIWKG